MEAVIFIGIQGSGKSSFYRERFFSTHVRINLDMLKTRHREGILLDACLRSKQPFAVDNTNPAPEDRARYVAPARAAGFHRGGLVRRSSVILVSAYDLFIVKPVKPKAALRAVPAEVSVAAPSERGAVGTERFGKDSASSLLRRRNFQKFSEIA